MDAPWLNRYRLIGDEDCGVGIECRDHFDGGRPLAYYESGGGTTYAADPAVQSVSTIAGLLTAAEVHEHEKHGRPAPQIVNIHVAGSVTNERDLTQAVQRAILNNRLGGDS